MATKATMPSFGNILNAGIQTVKHFANRPNGIPIKTFHNKLYEFAAITEGHNEITYRNPDYAHFDYEEYMFDSCLEELIDLLLTCLVAMGVVKSEVFNLEPNLGQTFANFIAFNEVVTTENLIKIDPFGKIYFWLACDNFRQYDNQEVFKNYKSNLERFDNSAFKKLKLINEACYGKNGDPLINHFIKETMRRTSVFMNNYADVVLGNDFVKVTPDVLLQQILHLTPTQFEHLCLKVVEMALINEEPNAKVSLKHTGQSNDNGLDGILTQDFGGGNVHTYYIQSKLYAQGNNISNSAIRNFLGAYPPNKEFHHGIFITTSDFTDPAKRFADDNTTHSLTLINQFALLELMLDHEIGVEKVQTETLVMDKAFFKKLKKK